MTRPLDTLLNVASPDSPHPLWASWELRTGLGVVLFALNASIPALLPAVIDVVKPGATVGIKEAYERIMKVHGRWIGALLLLGAGAFVGVDAWRDLPGR